MTAPMPTTPESPGGRNAVATAKWLDDRDRDFFEPLGLNDATGVLAGPFSGEHRYKNARTLQSSYALAKQPHVYLIIHL